MYIIIWNTGITSEQHTMMMMMVENFIQKNSVVFCENYVNQNDVNKEFGQFFILLSN